MQGTCSIQQCCMFTWEAKIATFTRNLQEVSLAVAQADQLVVRGLL